MEENIEKYINNIKDIKLSDVDNEFIKYLTLFKERFGRNAYISEPNGTKEQTIEAIKICRKILEKTRINKLKIFPEYVTVLLSQR